MTNSEIKKAVEIMLAYANGKEIECKESDSDSGWRCCNDPGFDWFHYDYRIKSEPKCRPFKNKEECWNEMMKHQPFGWVKEISSEMLYLINGISDMSIVIMENIDSFKEAMNIYEFMDGAPFGVVEE